jgi:excisionase family DNA binding protein
MSTAIPNTSPPTFYTVREAARILRVEDPATLYRAIRDDAFPAVRIRTRYVVPAAALHTLVTQAAESGGCVDVAQIATHRRTARDIARLAGVRRGDPRRHPGLRRDHRSARPLAAGPDRGTDHGRRAPRTVPVGPVA